MPEVLADLTVLDHLPTQALVGLRRQVRHLDADIDAAITSRMAKGIGRQDMGAVMGIEEAAKRLDTSSDSLYRKHNRLRLGYIDPLDGRLKFTEQEISDYIRRQRRG